MDFKGVVVIVGNCGSGKTEVSVNLALDQIIKGHEVKIADLDLVNPYFRVREVIPFLSKLGIEVVIPPKKYLHADLPILSPVVSGIIKSNSDLVILDVGGAGIGSTVLGSLSCFLNSKDIQLLYVINPNRPYSDSIETCLRMRDEIELAAKAKITGIISNANLMNETEINDIYDGYNFVLEVSKYMNIPICCVAVPIKKISNLDTEKIMNCPILPLRRQLVPPWVHSELV